MEVAELAGTVVFAVSGVFAVADRRIDWFGAVVVGVVAAIGGGTLRGLVLGQTPVFWIDDMTYLGFAVAGSLIAIPLVSRLGNSARRFEEGLQLADAMGLALFSIVGASATLELGESGAVAVICGFLTGVGGGLVRDLLVGKTPLIIRSEIYATAALAGTIVFVLLKEAAGAPLWISSITGMSMIFGIRLASLKKQWSLPILGGNNLPD
ncbi:MAG: trimeric intracellular cation channel family protein [Actinomycetota bacterium]|nr:trimeric intracellular cation channel family protein [Actinomycetota bacterium]